MTNTLTPHASPLPYPALHEEVLPGGGHRSFILRRGRLLRLTDIEGGANVSMLLFNAFEKTERLNLPDSLKCQHTAKLTRGHCLYSDMGRVLAAITADTTGWSDSLGGVLNADEVRAKYGDGPYQTLRNACHRNGTDNLLVELGKWGMGLEDLLMVLNLFSRVSVDAAGGMHFVPGNSKPGDHIELYAPMDTLVVMTALQHPMDPSPDYAPRPVRLSWMQADPAIAEHCRTSRPENVRGFINTENLYL
ncbi:urea carboxylase-related aminomethyltransferase [Thauera sp. 28]|uniref:urea amidolyase associated protein UAAP1 n=1 Tax=Thauera sp. 28 TaxID=303682 RepID=UPI0002D0E611|nr:urea amidolyase associated protein UAAP1 [Thauera sp. 28]ENO92633.1 urea carboxylase-related aminomethyltransferase [Thauera sp. 28]